jgi:hypothetical protein
LPIAQQPATPAALSFQVYLARASAVEAAFRQVDTAVDHLCDTLGLKPAA